MRRRRLASLALTAAVAVTLSACAADNQQAVEAEAFTQQTLEDPVIPIGPGSMMTVETFEWGFDIIEGFAVDGEIEIELINIGDAEHNIQFDGAAGDNSLVQAAGGETETGTIALFGAPGGQEYTYYCSIPGHRAQGMEGELLVYAEVEEAEEGPLSPSDAPA